MQDFTFQINVDEASYALVHYEGDEANIIIPDTYAKKPITIIGDKVFAGHSEITSLHMPDTVTDLGEFVFDGCENLKHLTLPQSMERLWGYTFVRCGLEEITLPDTLGAIPPFAFKDCKHLKKVVGGTGLQKVYAWAFGGCESLTDVQYHSEPEISPEAFQSKQLNT